MKKALLVALKPDRLTYPARGRFRYGAVQRRPLLGLLYLCAALESKGIPCELWDQSVTAFSLPQLAAHLKENRYLFVGFYSQLLIQDKLAEYVKKIKEACPAQKVVIGGPGHLNGGVFLGAGCDIVCRGESETTITQISDHFRGERKIQDIDGISYSSGGTTVRNKDRELIPDLDRIPFPSWERVDVRSYYDLSILPLRYPFVPMITSRGCPHSCAFCSSPQLWGNTYRVRSVQNVTQEIDELIDRYRIKYIIFQDDAFGTDNNWLGQLCSALAERRHTGLRWMCILHPLVFGDNARRTIGLMSEAGCDLFALGLQTVDPRIASSIHRDPLEPLRAREIIETAKRLGMMTSIDFIFGLPQETKETIRQNLKFVSEVRPSLVNFHPLYLEPGSELERTYKDSRTSAFSDKDVHRFCMNANARFYANPRNLARILRFAAGRLTRRFPGVRR